MSAHLSAVDRAHARLKEDILSGSLRVGPIDIRRLADRLRLSATPVREALARLSAERFVRRESSGYAVVLLTARRLEQLYQISGSLVDLALATARASGLRLGEEGMVDRPLDYAGRIHRLLHEMACSQPNRELDSYLSGINDRLLPARRAEALVFPEALQDAATLTDFWDARSLDALSLAFRAYHDARIERSDVIGRHLAAQAGDP